MARNVALLVAGMAFGVVVGAATGIHADPASAEIDTAADEAQVAIPDLLAATLSTGLDPWRYLRGTGELAPLKPKRQPPPPVVAFNPLVDCIIAHESRGYAGAVNPRSGASGLGQFLPSTWRTTPQGRAGLSVFDPVANRAAIQYMLDAGRGREFSTLGLCR